MYTSSGTLMARHAGRPGHGQAHVRLNAAAAVRADPGPLHGPDGRTYTGRTPEGRPLTFDSVQYADKYLARVNADIQAGRWVSPDAPRAAAPVTLAAYSAAWLKAGIWPGPPACCTRTR